MKKSIDKISGGSAPGSTQSPGLMPGVGSPGMMGGGMGMQQGTTCWDCAKPSWSSTIYCW